MKCETRRTRVLTQSPRAVMYPLASINRLASLTPCISVSRTKDDQELKAQAPNDNNLRLIAPKGEYLST
jgi:hypothetical protein